MAKKIKKPPITVVFDGTSLIPSIGSHTQNIPPITSVKDNKVSSAAGIAFDPIEYKIKPKHTNVPWTANRDWFLLFEIKALSVLIKINNETIAQKKPANATVVNFGVSFLHLKVTEKIEKPNADIRPKVSPNKEPVSKFPRAIMTIPTAAVNIATQTLVDIISFKNKKPNNAVIKGMAARQSKVIAADVLVIE